jgi:hypothetical protein
MASKLQLSSPVSGMNFIWNVSQHVGDNVSCPNQPTDVNLVKILIAETIRPNPPSWINRSIRIPFTVNGQMDIALAYWIRAFNDQQGSALSPRQAGIISPARGASYGRGYWTIVILNSLLKQVAPSVWQDIPNHRSASPQLRSELL